MEKVNKRIVVSELLARAEALLEHSRSEEAIPLLRQVLAVDPEDVHVQCQLARALNNTGRNEEALTAIENTLQQNPDNEWPQRVRAHILMDMGQARQALLSAREAARLEPDHPYTQFVLARALLAVRKYTEARKVAQHMVKQWPEDVSGFQMLGYIAIKQEKWAEAEEYLAEALHLDPEDEYAMHNMGVAVQSQGYLEEAINTYFMAVKSAPDNSNAVESLYTAVQHYLNITDRHLSVRKRLEKFHPAICNFYLSETRRRRGADKKSRYLHFMVLVVAAYCIVFALAVNHTGFTLEAAWQALSLVTGALFVFMVYKLFVFGRHILLEWSYGKPVVGWLMPTLFGPGMFIYAGVAGMIFSDEPVWLLPVLIGVVLSVRLMLIRAKKNFRYWLRSRRKCQ